MSRLKGIEQSINKKFRKQIWNNFVGAVKDYRLIETGDKIAVCISGGKDSVLAAKCMQELQRHSEIEFQLRYLVMDPGYSAANRRKIEENARLLEIPIEIFETDIFDAVKDCGGSPCYLCARMRRGHLYKNAQLMGCNKIALGHHLDDMVETLLMSMIYGCEIKTMMPKLNSTNYGGMELIRPLYKVREADIIAWKNYNELEFINCACRFTEMSAEQGEDEITSKRLEMKLLIKELRNKNPNADLNLFRSVHNVNLGAVVGTRDCDGGETHSFLEGYVKV